MKRPAAWGLAGSAVAAACCLGGGTDAGILLALGAAGEVAGGAPAERPAERAEDALAALPAPPRARLREPSGDPRVVPLSPHVAVSIAPPATVLLTGRIAIARGPGDHGLESLVCLAGGRMHESLVGLDSGDAPLLKTACLAAFGWRDGQGSAEGEELPPRGVPVRIELRWMDEDGNHRIVDASCLVRDRRSDRGLPPLPYVWTGSAMTTVIEPDGAGGTRTVQAFMLAMDRVLAANENSSGALFASPLPPSSDLMRWEVNTALAPHLDHPIAVQLTRAELPLELRLHPDGDLALPDGTRPDDGALALRLAAAFAAAPPEALRAVRVRVHPEVERARDLAARVRLLHAAARAGVWCVPVFEPDGADPGPDPLHRL